MRDILILLNTDFLDITDFGVCHCWEMCRTLLCKVCVWSFLYTWRGIHLGNAND